MSRTRTYCKCFYCPFLSVKFSNVKAHLEYKHPDEEPIVQERYDDIPAEVTEDGSSTPTTSENSGSQRTSKSA